MNQKFALFICLLVLSVSARGNTCSDGAGETCNKPEINILFLGQSGAGKSSLINMLYNSLGGVSYREPWKIIIPLFHKPTAYPVNVEEYKKYNVELKSGGGSQTAKVNKYTIETKHEKIVLWDTPGFSDTTGFERDMENASKITTAIASTSFHAVIIPLKSDNIDRSSETDEFHVTINQIRRMLPKSFLGNLIGVFNKAGSETPTHEDGLRDGFFEALKIPPGTMNLQSRVYFVDGSGFFMKMDSRASQYKLKLGKIQWEEGDGLMFAEMLQAARSSTPVSGLKVREIQQKIKEIEDQVEILSGKIQDQRRLEVKLENIKTSIGHEERRRDANAGYRKTSPAEYAQTIEFWPGKRMNPHHDKGAFGRALRTYYDQNGHACESTWYCDVRIKDAAEWNDEHQLNEHNAAKREIDKLNTDKTNCEGDITKVKDAQRDVIAEIDKLQKEWRGLAMMVDFTPMVKRVEKKMSAIEEDASKEKNQKDIELDSYRQIKKMYHEIQGQMHIQ